MLLFSTPDLHNLMKYQHPLAGTWVALLSHSPEQLTSKLCELSQHTQPVSRRSLAVDPHPGRLLLHHAGLCHTCKVLFHSFPTHRSPMQHRAVVTCSAPSSVMRQHPLPGVWRGLDELTPLGARSEWVLESQERNHWQHKCWRTGSPGLRRLPTVPCNSHVSGTQGCTPQ